MSNIDILKNHLISYGKLGKYLLNDIVIPTEDSYKKNIYIFFEKFFYLLDEFSNDIYIENNFSQKMRLLIEYSYNLKFICCSSNIEEMYYRTLIYDFLHQINLYNYFIKITNITKEFYKQDFTKLQKWIDEKRKKEDSIQVIYEKILKNTSFKDSIFSKKIDFKENTSQFNIKKLLNLNQMYWYSLCSNYRNLNELFLGMVYNYTDYVGMDFKEKNIKDDLKNTILTVNTCLKTKIELANKTDKTLISELKDIINNPKKSKNIKKDLNKEIQKFINIKAETDYLTSLYDILSYKVHACDILENENNIYTNSLIYLKTFHVSEVYPLIIRFVDIFYENNLKTIMKLFIYAWKSELDYYFCNSSKNINDMYKIKKDLQEIKKIGNISEVDWRKYEEILNLIY